MTDNTPIAVGQAKPVALVTGASRGIGHQVARQLVASGAHVLAGARDPDGAAERYADLDEGALQLVKLDVTDQVSIDRLAARVEAGAGRLDILVNNAGVALDA